MADRAESAIVLLVLAAAGLVLAAPVLGRAGAGGAADAAMAAAALCGVAAFTVAGAVTLRAARHSGGSGPHREDGR